MNNIDIAQRKLSGLCARCGKKPDITLSNATAAKTFSVVQCKEYNIKPKDCCKDCAFTICFWLPETIIKQ